MSIYDSSEQQNKRQDITSEILTQEPMISGTIYRSGITLTVRLHPAQIMSHEQVRVLIDGLNNFYDAVSPEDIMHLNALLGQKWETDMAYEDMPPPNIPLPRTGIVYLLRSVNLYKIGQTTQTTKERVKQIQADIPHDIEIICEIHTLDIDVLESKLHERFADKRKRGEWFALAPDDVEYIKSLGGNQ